MIVLNGQLANGTSGEAFTGPAWVYYAAGRWYMADADDAAKPAQALCFDSPGAADAAIQVYLGGHVYGWPVSLTAGKDYYLSTTPGAMTSTAPVSGSFQRLGFSIGETEFVMAIAPRVVISAGGGGGLSDGDKGDLTVSDSGVTWSLNDSAVTNAKLADMVGPSVKGIESGTGAPEDLTPTQLKSMIGLSGLVTLASDATTSLATLSDVVGMNFTAEANKVYIVEFMGTFTGSFVTSGIGLVLNIPSGTISGMTINQLASQTNTSHAQIADDAIAGTTSSNGTGTSGNPQIGLQSPLYGRWLVSIGGTGGTVQLRFRSEIGGTTVTIPAANPAVLFYRKMN